MAVNKPVGDNARKGAVRKRSQLRTKVMARKPGPSEAGRPVSSSIRRKPRQSSRSKACAGNARNRRQRGLEQPPSLSEEPSRPPAGPRPEPRAVEITNRFVRFWRAKKGKSPELGKKNGRARS